MNVCHAHFSTVTVQSHSLIMQVDRKQSHIILIATDPYALNTTCPSISSVWLTISDSPPRQSTPTPSPGSRDSSISGRVTTPFPVHVRARWGDSQADRQAGERVGGRELYYTHPSIHTYTRFVPYG